MCLPLPLPQLHEVSTPRSCRKRRAADLGNRDSVLKSKERLVRRFPQRGLALFFFFFLGLIAGNTVCLRASTRQIIQAVSHKQLKAVASASLVIMVGILVQVACVPTWCPETQQKGYNARKACYGVAPGLLWSFCYAALYHANSILLPLTFILLLILHYDPLLCRNFIYLNSSCALLSSFSLCLCNSGNGALCQAW